MKIGANADGARGFGGHVSERREVAVDNRGHGRCPEVVHNRVNECYDYNRGSAEGKVEAKCGGRSDADRADLRGAMTNRLDDPSEAARARTPGDRLSVRVRQVCDAVGTFIEYWGFKAIHGRLWTLLALSSSPMTQVEVADFLDVSRSLVSGAMSELLEHGLVRPTADHRNAPYMAVLDVWPTISDVLRGREWMLIESARLALEGAIEAAEMSREVSPRFAVERMRFLLRMTEIAQAFLRILVSLRVPRKLEGFGGLLKDTAKFLQGLAAV